MSRRGLSIAGWWLILTVSAVSAGIAVRWVDERSWQLVLNTLWLSLATGAISLPVGTFLAVLLFRTDVPARRVFALVFIWLIFVPLYLQAAAWLAGFGTLGAFVQLTGGRIWLEGFAGAVFVHALASTPWVVSIVGLGLWFAEPQLEEEALLDASPAIVLRRVTMRRALASLGVAALWVILSTAGEMIVTDLFQVRTYAEVLYTDLAIGREPGEAALRTLPGVLFSAWMIVAALVFCAYVTPPRRASEVRARRRYELGPWRWPCFAMVFACAVVAVGVPIASLCYQAGIEVTQVGDLRERHWSVAKLLTMVAESPIRSAREFGATVLIGTVAATVAAAAGTILGWFARRGGWRSAAALSTVAVGLALPGPVIGLSLIWVLNRRDPSWIQSVFEAMGIGGFELFPYLYDRTYLAPIAALVIRATPWATLIMWYALRSVATDTVESAATEGAGRATRLWRIALPQRIAAVLTAWFVAMAVAWSDLGATILVMPPGVTTVSIHIFNLLHYGVDDRVAGLCLATLIAVGILAAAIMFSLRRWRS